MRKLFVALFFSIIALTGCGSDSDSLTIGVFGTPTEIENYTNLGMEFTEETGIELTFKQYTDFTTEIQAELIGGTAPDVFYVDAYTLPFFVEQGVLEPLDGKFDTSDYSDNLLDAFTRDGVMYALPKDYSTLAVYYNKEYVDPAELPTSYEELPAYLEELDGTLPDDVVPMTLNVDLARMMDHAQNGGDMIIDPETNLAQLNTDTIATNLSYEFEMAKDGLMVSPADLGFGWNGEVFGSGKTAIMLEGNWVVGELRNNYPDIEFGVMEDFSLNDKVGSMLFTVGWGINAASSNKEGAESYLEFMARPENVKTISEQNGTLPPTNSVAVDMGLADDDVFGPHVKASEYATVWQAGNTLSTVNNEFMNYAPSVVSGDRTLAEALEETDVQANKIIEASAQE